MIIVFFYVIALISYRFCLQIEAVSCDEMYVDVTNLLEVRCTSEDDVHFTNPFLLGLALRRQVREITQCSATCGFGTNRLLARLATKRAKPNGQALFLGPDWRLVQSSYEVEGEKTRICELASPEGREYLEDLPLAHLPGVSSFLVHTAIPSVFISRFLFVVHNRRHNHWFWSSF